MKPQLFSTIRNSLLVTATLLAFAPAAYSFNDFDPQENRLCIDKVKAYLADHTKQRITDDDFKECYLQYSKSSHYGGRSFSEFACIIGVYASVERLQDSFGLNEYIFRLGNEGSNKMQYNGGPLEISAFDLMSLYENNQLKADNLFKNKNVTILGEISDIRKDPDFGDVVVEIKADNFGIFSITAYIDKDAEQSALAFRIGEQIKLSGTVLGFAELGAGVDVENATLGKL